MDQDKMATFVVEGQDADTFEVVDFNGTDALSTPYRFSVTLLSRNPDFTPSNMTMKGAKLTIYVSQEHNAYSGIIFEFKYLRTVKSISFFRVVLTPRLSLLTLVEHNQVFLQMTLPEILKQVFADANLMHYELRTYADYPRMDYVCQYNETTFNFISRWMESRGLYYYFEETDEGERLIIVDSKTAHTQVSDHSFRYGPKSGLRPSDPILEVFSFVSQEQVVPSQVVLKDYNYLKPTLELTAKAKITDNGAGIRYHYGDNYQTQEEGNTLAKIRAEGYLCEATTFHGESGCLLFRAGGLFTLKMHPYASFNSMYLLTSVTHSGRNTAYLSSGIPDKGQDNVKNIEQKAYRNTFAALESQSQYRPALRTEQAKFHGVISAFIDGSGSGEYATIDEMGRYKVQLPFELAGKSEMEASWWFRLAEPYSGPAYGMHFPLLKNTEVLLSFVDGNPDRPVIASAVFNTDSTNPVSNKNQALNVIRTKRNNHIVLGDKKGQEFVGLWSPSHNSGIAVGATKEGGGGGFSVETAGDYEAVVVGGENKVVVGGSSEIVAGAESKMVLGSGLDLTVGLDTGILWGGKMEYMKGTGYAFGDEIVELHEERGITGTEKITMQAGIPEKAISTGWTVAMPIVAALLTIAGNSIATASNVKEGEDDDEDSDGDSAGGFFSQLGSAMKSSWGGDATALAEPILALIGAFTLVKKTSKKIEEAFEKLAVCNVEMSDEGLIMEVNPTPTKDSKFELTVTPSSMYPTIGFADEATQTMTKNSWELEVTHGMDIKTEFSISDKVELTSTGSEISLSKTNGGSLTLTATGGSFSKANTGNVTISNDSVVVEKNAGGKITLQEGTAEVNAGAKMTLNKEKGRLEGPSGQMYFEADGKRAYIRSTAMSIQVLSSKIIIG